MSKTTQSTATWKTGDKAMISRENGSILAGYPMILDEPISPDFRGLAGLPSEERTGWWIVHFLNGDTTQYPVHEQHIRPYSIPRKPPVWVATAEKLPPPLEIVLGFWIGLYDLCHRREEETGDTWWCGTGKKKGNRIEVAPDYWQELPEPPC
jgi:hypothetical protein